MKVDWGRVAKGKNRFYLGVIVICLLLQLFIGIVQSNPHWVEQYYSRGFYPKFSFLSIILFSWLPFSVGDLMYGMVVVLFVVLLYRGISALFRKKWQDAVCRMIQLVALITFLYTFFYVNWGLNYFRVPLADQIGLDVKSISIEDYAQVIEKYIGITNDLRDSLVLNGRERRGVGKDLQEWMRQDTVFKDMLCHSQIHGKSPLSSTIISYFSVSGYFNPFTLEAHVNQRIPLVSYPFVNVHELAHQMGVGFEDECNFIAFRKLMDHPNAWYRYSAYYEATQYLIYPLYTVDKQRYEKYRHMLSPKVRQDLEEERAFWRQYRSWINRLSNLFYDQYLMHNNQPEGMERYSMMARLVVAWEKQQGNLTTQVD